MWWRLPPKPMFHHNLYIAWEDQRLHIDAKILQWHIDGFHPSTDTTSVRCLGVVGYFHITTLRWSSMVPNIKQQNYMWIISWQEFFVPFFFRPEMVGSFRLGKIGHFERLCSLVRKQTQPDWWGSCFQKLCEVCEIFFHRWICCCE